MSYKRKGRKRTTKRRRQSKRGTGRKRTTKRRRQSKRGTGRKRTTKRRRRSNRRTGRKRTTKRRRRSNRRTGRKRTTKRRRRSNRRTGRKRTTKRRRRSIKQLSRKKSVSRSRVNINTILNARFESRYPGLLKNGMYVKKGLKTDDEKDIYLLCDNTGVCNKVIKILFRDDFISKNEILMTKLFARYGLGPEVFETGDSFNIYKYTYIIMDKIDEVLTKYLQTKKSSNELDVLFESIKVLVDKLCSIGLVHGDLHWDNIGIDNGKLILIDFGWSSQMPCRKDLEFLQLYRTISMFNFNNFNVSYLSNKLKTYLENDLGVKLENDINKMFMDYHIKYQTDFYNNA